MFFFIVHFYLLHALAVLAAIARGLPVGWLCSNTFLSDPPPEWPLSLPGVYAVWAFTLVLLYLPCRWFAGVKRRILAGGCRICDR